MLPREVVMVSEWTDLPRKYSVKRFEQSRREDTAIYKNIPFITFAFAFTNIFFRATSLKTCPDYDSTFSAPNSRPLEGPIYPNTTAKYSGKKTAWRRVIALCLLGD